MSRRWRDGLVSSRRSALACSDPREAELVQELAGLQESRVPKASLARMKEEADAAEARDRGARSVARDRARGDRGARGGGRGPRGGDAAGARAEPGPERRDPRGAAGAAAGRRGAGGRRAEVAKQKARAQTFVDQAGVLTRELRPDDPDWAIALRVRTLGEFLKEVGSAWPRDPVLGEVGRRPLPEDPRGGHADRRGARRAGARAGERGLRARGAGDAGRGGRAPGRRGRAAGVVKGRALRARGGRARSSRAPHVTKGAPLAAEPVRQACTTVDGAPAATSEPLVLGMRKHMEARDAAGLQKYLDLGQAMILRGGHVVEVLERRPEQSLVKVRRGPRSLPFWTVEQGIACASVSLER